MRSSKRSLIVTFMGPVLLGALSLAAYGCSGNDNTSGTKSTSCKSAGATTHATAVNTINVASCKQADVQAAIDSASDGDTVVVPAGTCTWITQVKIGKIFWTHPVTYESKSITLQGAGIGKTIIIDKIPKNGTASEILLEVYGTEGKSFRITGLTIRGGATNIGWDGAITVGGTSRSWRIDHIKFENLKTRAIRTGGDTYGVIDHNIFYRGGSAIYVGGNGDGSWNRPLSLGTEKAVYVEDNVFDVISAASRTSIDAGSGARYVFRHNITNTTAINHGTETSGRVRSAFSFEVYNNTFTNTENWWSAMQFRGGTGVIFDNTVTGYQALAHVSNYRDSDNYKFWGQCDGTSPYDKNDGVTYDSGASTENNSVGILTSSGKNWAANQWVGYSIHNTTTSKSSVITANTANTITAQRGTRGSGNYVNWAVGDNFIILKAYPCLDQVGWSTGNLLSNYDPPLPQEWPQQVFAPLYEWSNILNGVNADIKSQSPHIKKARDYYDVPDSMVGALSARPSTCAPYEAYFAADQGSQGTLYKCVSANTWTAYYTPYTYPHPLTLSLSSTPPNQCAGGLDNDSDGGG